MPCVLRAEWPECLRNVEPEEDEAKASSKDGDAASAKDSASGAGDDQAAADAGANPDDDLILSDDDIDMDDDAASPCSSRAESVACADDADVSGASAPASPAVRRVAPSPVVEEPVAQAGSGERETVPSGAKNPAQPSAKKRRRIAPMLVSADAVATNNLL